jgi:hypothetical protein
MERIDFRKGLASQQPPPRRFIAGADAMAIAEQKVALSL